jgi:transposase
VVCGPRTGRVSRCTARIRDWLEAEVSAATVTQRLRDDHGVAASESSVRRWISANPSEEAVREKVTVARGLVQAGSEAQIDYGRLGMWFDPVSARRVAVWAFVMVLAHSRHLFVQPALGIHQPSWCASHVAAFEFFGGVPVRLVPDNLKPAVTRPDLYDPKINKAYAELAAHYRCLIDPARANKPKDKPRVERPMQYVRDSFWRGGEFTPLEQMQTAAQVWCRDVAGARASRALDGQQPGFVFSTVEQQALLPLPRNEFQHAVWSSGKVATDCHVKVGKALYSVPWRLMGQQVHARTCGDIVQIVHGGNVVATHVSQHRGRATEFEHYPPQKIAFTMRNPPGVAGWPPRSDRPARTSSRSSWNSTPSTDYAALKVSSPCARRSATSAWRPPARGPSPSATRATAPSRASSPPAPNSTEPPHRRHRKPQSICADPKRSTPTPVRPRESHIVLSVSQHLSI